MKRPTSQRAFLYLAVLVAALIIGLGVLAACGSSDARPHGERAGGEPTGATDAPMTASPSIEGDSSEVPSLEAQVLEAQLPEAGWRGTVAAPAAGGESGFYLGVGSCLGSGCHGSTEARSDAAILGNEYYTWLRKDPHQGAFDVLYGQRSKTIARNLGLGQPAHRAPACLECHSAFVPEARVAGSLTPADGITCEVCHGPASGWRDGHTDPGWTHADSVERGLVDQRDLSRRGEGCLGCHLGDERRTVDHELIAAGHPILIFELDNYTQQMPPHWKPGSSYAGASHGAPAWAVGQAVAFREGLEQLERRARSGQWPEFSELSCYACHHSIADERWREEGRFRRRERPGLPPWSPARWQVLRHVVRAASPGEVESLDRDIRALARAVERMNQPGEVADLAARAAAAMDRVIPRVESRGWSAGEVRALLRALADDPELKNAPDVHTAEQAFFAVQTLASYLVQGDPRTARGPLPRSLDRLYATLEDPEAFDAGTFAKRLAEVAAAAG